MSTVALSALPAGFQTPLARLAAQSRNSFSPLVAALLPRMPSAALPTGSMPGVPLPPLPMARAEPLAEPSLDAAATPTASTVAFREYLKALAQQWRDSPAPRLLPEPIKDTGPLGQLLDVRA